MSRWLWAWKQITHKLWYRATLYCVIGLLVAVLAIVIGPLIPENVTRHIGTDAVDVILGVIASSMLAVTTFSLTIMISASASAGSAATPRAVKLVDEDLTAQRALSTFLGTFLFSLVSLIALHTGLCGPGGRVVLLAATLGLVALIVVTLLRWISRLTRIGRMGETTRAVEAATTEAMHDYRDHPWLGGSALENTGFDPAIPPPGWQPVHVQEIGYLRHLDMTTLAGVAKGTRGKVHVLVRPGALVAPHRPVAYLEPAGQDQQAEDRHLHEARSAFMISPSRSFEQDPRFGVIVLAEIASHSLPPVVNDSGTAIGIISNLVRVLAQAIPPTSQADAPATPQAGQRDKAREAEESLDRPAVYEPKYPDVHLPTLTHRHLLDDAFFSLSRDCAGLVEVGIRLQKGLAMLAELHEGYREPALLMARSAASRAMEKLTFEQDRQRLMEAAQWAQAS